MKQNSGRYNHKKTENDGMLFDSGMESDCYDMLKKKLENNEIAKIEKQVPFLLQEKFIIIEGQAIKGSHPDFEKLKRKYKAETIQAIKYITDFVITENDGSLRAIDPKGISTTEFKIKRKMFMLLYPNIPLDVIVYNKKTKQWENLFEYEKEKKNKKKKRKCCSCSTTNKTKTMKKEKKIGNK